MAKEDLISIADRTTEEQQAIATKGGIASGKARREKKAMKDTLAALLSMPLRNGKGAEIESIKNLAEVKGKNITVQEAIMLAQIQKAIKGDTRAFKVLMELASENGGQQQSDISELYKALDGDDD